MHSANNQDKISSMQDYKNPSYCEDGIEKTVTSITDLHLEACRVMPNGYREGPIFLSHPHISNGFLFLAHH